MIKITCKIEGLDKLESDMKKEAEKILAKELKAESAKIERISELEAEDIDAGLETIPSVKSHKKIEVSPKIKPTGSLQKNRKLSP